jgi:hypothetical protein
MQTMVSEQTVKVAPRRSRRAFVVLAWVFGLGVAAQAFLAGAGVFAGGSWMLWHIGLGHFLSSPIPIIPLVMVILSFVARLPRYEKQLAGLLLVLAGIQPVFVYLRGVSSIIAAFHPLNALLLFVLSFYLVLRMRNVEQGAVQ